MGGCAEAERWVAEAERWVAEAETRWLRQREGGPEVQRWVAVPRQRDGWLRYRTEMVG